MYNTTAQYKEYIKKPSRDFECRVKIGNRAFTNTEVIEIVPETVQPNDGFSIGNTVSQSIDITLKNDGGVYASAGIVDVAIGLKVGNKIEYVPIGTYNIDDVIKTDYTVKLTCYDNMIKFETGYFEKYENPTLQQVIEQLEETTGVKFEGTVPSYTVTKLSGYTCREILAYVASICGGNAFITRDGNFTIKVPKQVDYKITAANYFNTGYTNEDSTYKIGMITCKNKTNTDYTENEGYDSANDKNTISVGSLSSDTMELTFENPWVTENILNDIYSKLKDFSYLGYTMKWQGDMSLDVGDIVTVVDKNNVTRKAFIYANKLDYKGGLTQETSAKGETKNSNSFSASGNGISEIDRIAVKLLIAEKAIINKANIKDLQATNAKIEKLDANVANINTALIKYATIEMLNAVKANISDLVAKDAQIENALINKADITQLNAANANISKLNATVADIKTLVSGNLTSANIQSLVLTADKVAVQNGFIKNAMIESLAADKITTGTLNTNKISVSSSNGGLVIAGATQQFKDKNSKVRIQMGQDAQGNFNFILKAEDGTTTLIDGYGIKEKAIADKLIKTNMVADQAITSQQINYSSFIAGLNADTNTNYIKASKVAIDLTGQTLDIAFNSINTSVTNAQNTATTANLTANSAKSAIDNLQVGGRNLIPNSDIKTILSPWAGSHGSAITKVTTAPNNISFPNGVTSCIKNVVANGQSWAFTTQTLTLQTDTIYTISFWGYAPSSTKGNFHIAVYYDKSGWRGIGTITITERDKWVRKSYTFKSNKDYGTTIIGVGLSGSSAGNITYSALGKLELGNKATDWTPAPEDIDQAITTTNSNVSTLQSSVSILQSKIALKVEQSDINSAVTTLDGKIQSTNTTINNMQSSIDLRLNSITSKVNQSVSSRNLINNSALKNSLGHYYASNGGATYTRIVNKSEFNGWNYVSPPVCDNAIHIRYDKPGDNYVEFFDLLAKVKPNTKYTISYYYSIDSSAGSSNLSASSSYIYYRKADGSYLPDPNFAIDINFPEYTGRNRWVRCVKTFTTPNVYELDNLILRFGFWQSSSSLLEMLVTGIQVEEGDLTEWTEGVYSSVGTIITQSPTQVAIAIKNKTNSQAIFDSNGLTIENGQFKINKNGRVNLYIDSKGYLNSQSGLRVMDSDTEGQPETFISETGIYMEYYYRNANVLKDTRLTPEKNGIRCDRNFFTDGGIDVEDDLWVGGDLQVKGRKHCMINTDNYGNRLINAYETAEYYFGDIGRAILDNNGECIIYIDDIFGECVNTQIQYEVFTSVYNGKLDENEPIIMNDNYFILKGRPNSLIGWEIKAKRKGWENVRLEEKLDYDDFVEELNEINFMDDKTTIDKVEDILFDEEV